MARRIAVGIALLGIAGPAAGAPERDVVVMVFDGVAPALFETNHTPAFARLRSEGAWSHDLEPAFPTISLINGFTLSTGCWPARHGIVTNKFLDPERGLYDHSSDADWLTGCEGLHVAAERQGVTTAALGWYGSWSDTRGALASVVAEARFAEYPDDGGRADQVIAQLSRTDADRPRLVLAYFKGPDGAQHFSGVDSPETQAKVAAMDGEVGRVMAAIEASGRPTALLVTTDHGMREVSHIVNVRRILAWHGIEAEPVSTGTTSFLYFDDDGGGATVEAAYTALAGYEEFDLLRGDALPEYARLGNGGRVPELIISAKHPYFIEDTELWPAWLRWLGRWGPRFVWARPFLKATHGYPPDVEGMSGVLYAWGDGVANGREVERVRSIDLHPTVTQLLGIAPGRPVDGRVARGFLTPAAP
jgi:hypothetical protein